MATLLPLAKMAYFFVHLNVYSDKEWQYLFQYDVYQITSG